MPPTNVIAVAADGWVDRATDLEPRGRHSVFGFFRRWWNGVRYFHRDGHVYTITAAHPPRRLGILDRILAGTVYNPRLEFAYDFERGSTYAMPELRSALRVAIERDDDVLTQFHEPEELLARLGAASSFDEIVSVLELAATQPEAS